MTAATRSDPLAALRGAKRAYAVEPLKLLYVSTAKNACTSLKWLIAELAGEDLSRFRPGLTAQLNDDAGVHQRHLWQKVPKLNQLTPELRGSIRPDNGWFVFGVVRDPRVRLFSAWESKYLLHDPAYRRWRGEPWFPAMPATFDDVVESFARFVELLDKHPDHQVTHDSHFLSQSKLLRPDVVPYSKVYEISEISTALLADLGEHLHAQGWSGELKLRRSNDTPLRANRHVFAEPVRSQIEKHYAEDFERYGHLWDFAKIDAAKDWTPAEFSELRARIELDERVGDLLAEARRANRRVEKLERRLERARRANAGQSTSADTVRAFWAAAMEQLHRVSGKVRRVIAGWRGVPPPSPPRKKKSAKGKGSANAARRRKAAG